MSKVRIVGGGLDGVLAAFEAHRLGFRDIELHERADRLGGQALPKVDHGLELREVDVRFSADRDRARELLEWHGIAFDAAEARCGSVSPSAAGGAVFVEDFDGPALTCRGLALAEPAGETLADRIRAYPAEMQAPLSRYAEWRLGDWIDTAHASAAEALGMARVYPIGADVSTLEELRRTDSLYGALYGLPPAKLGRAPARAALPHDGFAGLFETARRRLEGLGVTIHDASLVSPQEALARCAEGETVVWSADPAQLFRPFGVAAPRPARRNRAVYIFKAEFDGPRPFFVANYTGEGAVARLNVYESRGQALVAAECVAETPDGTLRREIQRLTAGFGAAAAGLGDLLAVSIRAAETPSVDGMARRAELRHTLQHRSAGAFLVTERRPATRLPDLDVLSQALGQRLEPANAAEASSAAA